MSSWLEEVAGLFRRVDDLGLLAGDPEAAHSEEDSIHRVALILIGSGRLSAEVAMRVANKVLQTEDVEFPRWSA